MKLTLFAWIPASSAGMTILLFAAQLNAAGVCIICPPGHTCPAGGGPTLQGNTGQILQRTATGTQWVNASAVQGAQGPQGAVGAQGAMGPNMTGAQLRAAMCPAPASTTNEHVVVHWRCSGSQTDPSSLAGFDVIGYQSFIGRFCWCRGESRANPGCFSSWNSGMSYAGVQDCVKFCPNYCKNPSAWRGQVTW